MFVVNQTSIENILSEQQIQALRQNQNISHRENHDPAPVVHLSLPETGIQWLLTEIDENFDMAFGLCDLGQGFPELGYVSMHEVLDITPFIVSDPHFVGKAPISEYAKQARIAGEIVLSWDGLEPEINQMETMTLSSFLNEFRGPLLEQIDAQTPVVYSGEHESWQDDVLSSLKRTPFPAQAHRINACFEGLVRHDLPAIFLNGEMGTGKTMMGICLAALMYRYGFRKPVLVISPPHLVYKWRREILDTVPNSAVTVINGSNAIHDLIRFREMMVSGRLDDGRQHYLVIGRVRMRMGFYWRPAFAQRTQRVKIIDPETQEKRIGGYKAVACPCCGAFQTDKSGQPYPANSGFGSSRQEVCTECSEPLWTMRHKAVDDQNAETRLYKFLGQLPGIGKVTASKLVSTFGVENLCNIIDNNIYDFVNLQQGDGEFVFGDKHAQRLEKALGRLEFALQVVSYQPSEYVKRYFPRKAFSLALVDEAHEYKNQGSAQGQAMAVLCNEAEKVLCLTGTLMGGYASDLFYLLFRAMPRIMSEMGYTANRNNSFASAEERFMRNYGCLIDVFSVSDEGAHKTAKGRKVTTNTKKAPGFSAVGIAKFVLPYTVFMRITDLDNNVLPAYSEETRLVSMSEEMQMHYLTLKARLRSALDRALAKRDNSVTAVVINALLRWPETCFRAELVTHPHNRDDVLAQVVALYDAETPTPKEADLIQLCLDEQQQGRRVMVYTTYTGGHDTATRLSNLLKKAGLKPAVLRSTVSSDKREVWIDDKVEQGIDVLICNPELVKTGLDLLAFPTIYFMQTGYNAYTMAQASRRSWRIGQDQPVKVYFACYEDSSQEGCLELMAKKMKTALSTMGVMPETGLDSFIEEENDEMSITQQLAKSLLGA